MLHVIRERSPVVIFAFVLGGLGLVYQLLRFAYIQHRRSIFKRDRGCKPPASYPHKEPIFGLDIFLENVKLSKEGGLLEKFVERYKSINGGVYTYSVLLTGERVINTCEPENIKAVLATQFKDFKLGHNRKVALWPIFGHGIFTTDGHEWEASRALLRPNFARSQVGDIQTFEAHISKLIARIPRDGSTVDLQPLFFMLTLDSATEFLFGHSTNVLGTGTAHERGTKFSSAFGYGTERAGFQARLGRIAVLIPDKRYKEDVKYIHNYVGEYVQKAIHLHKQASDEEKGASGKGKYVFLEELAKTGYGAKKIQDELLNILLAGRDTTASLLSYLFWVLARRPDIYQKLRQEISQFDECPPTFEGIKSAKYLQWCLNEALRVFPIVPANGRCAVTDTTLPRGGGPDGKSPIFVKAGQMVNYQVYAMQRRKDLYGEDADEFKPERWETLRPSWQYLPFNGGPRICIGQQFALTEASYTTIRILQAFKAIESRDNLGFKEILTLTAAVRNGVQVSMIPA